MEVIKYYYTRPMKVYSGVVIGGQCLPARKVKKCKRFTFAVVFDDESETIKFGMATCSENDNFSKKIGRELSLQRARTEPIHVITGFKGIRNDFADEVMQFLVDMETKLVLKNYSAYI